MVVVTVIQVGKCDWGDVVDGFIIAHDLNLIRLYDSGENSELTLELIRQHDLPIKVMLGVWLSAEFSNHEGCAWLDRCYGK